MARSARSSEKGTKVRTVPVVQDDRPIERILPRSLEVGNPNIPVRTVIYVEIGDLEAGVARQITTEMLKGYPTAHPHYACVLRQGHLATDFEFEQEFLDTVNTLCEVVDGKIVLKGGARDVDVIRKKF